MTCSEEWKRFLLAGIGAAAFTAEKSKELAETLVQKGELTLRQGKILNQELKRNPPQKPGTGAEEKPAEKGASGCGREEPIADRLEHMTPEERRLLREKLAQMEEQDDAENAGANI